MKGLGQTHSEWMAILKHATTLTYDIWNYRSFDCLKCFYCAREDFQAMAGRVYDMTREEDRLNSFNNWNYNHIQLPRELAKAGLYYTGIADRVECPFCYGVLKKWEPSDIPYNEHSTHFPHCRFIRGYDVGNVPIEYSAPVSYSNNINNNYVYNIHNGNHYTSDINNGPSPAPSTPAVNIMLQSTPEATPDLQDYLKTEVNRLRTFSRWPPNLKQTPELLSEAGFYHLPTEERPDRVKCAYCQGKLFNWQEEDDPWIEHSRCFPNCPYVELCMGKEVVRELLENSTTQVPVENGRSENGANIVPPERPPPQPSQPSRESHAQTTQDTVPVRMNSEPVQAVLEMGFAEDLVKQTVEKCLRERPGNFPPAEELASMVMELEEPEVIPAATRAALPLTPLQRLMSANGMAKGSGVRSGIYDSQVAASKAPTQKKMVNGFGTVSSNGVQNGLNGAEGRDVNTDKLRTENSRMKDQLLCKICMENIVRVTFMPCGHLVCCGPCSMTMSECPICRSAISGCVRTYF